MLTRKQKLDIVSSIHLMKGYDAALKVSLKFKQLERKYECLLKKHNDNKYKKFPALNEFIVDFVLEKY